MRGPNPGKWTLEKNIVSRGFAKGMASTMVDITDCGNNVLVRYSVGNFVRHRAVSKAASPN